MLYHDVTLQGLSPVQTDSILLHLCYVTSGIALVIQQLSGLPADLQSLITQFQHLFDPPEGLPPPRACNHTIPLLPGSKPVAVRPYRYPPKLKDELEKQVADMLNQGLIKPSASEFSSPVLWFLRRMKGISFVWIIGNSILLPSNPSSQFPSLIS